MDTVLHAFQDDAWLNNRRRYRTVAARGNIRLLCFLPRPGLPSLNDLDSSASDRKKSISTPPIS